jgi:mRNA-degrading endonuclease RelE of RelBE toxin-antitoxin system
MARKDLRRLSRTDRERVERAVKDLPAGDIRQLAGWRPPTWRLRVGTWRVLYRLDPAARVLTVLTIRPRGNAYQP